LGRNSRDIRLAALVDEWIPAAFIAYGSDLEGVCIPSLKGKSLSHLAERIIG